MTSTTDKPPLFDGLANALATDYFFLREELTERQLEILTRVHRFVEDELMPEIDGVLGAGRAALVADQAARRARDRRGGSGHRVRMCGFSARLRCGTQARLTTNVPRALMSCIRS